MEFEFAKSKSKTPKSTTRCSRSRSLLVRAVVATLLVLVSPPGSSTVVKVDATPNPVVSALGSTLKSMDYRYFVAGGTCAAFSHGITTPIDVVKTKLQANPDKYKGKGLIGATLQICRDTEGGGPSTLLNGLGPTVVGYGLEGAMKFGAYEVAKPLFRTLLGDSRNIESFVIASFLAGAIASVLLVPMESLRIKQVTDPNYQNDTVLTGLPKILRTDGFWVTMSGIWAMLAKQVPYTFGKQVSFDLVAKFLYSTIAAASTTNILTKSLSSKQLKWVVTLLSAVCASIAACLLSQPGDMILTETYNTGSKTKSDKKRSSATSTAISTTPGNFGTVVSSIYGRGGVSEFFRGTQARLVHVGMIITSQLMVYDFVKQLLGLPATGSH